MSHFAQPVPLAGQTNTNSQGDSSDPLSPENLAKGRIELYTVLRRSAKPIAVLESIRSRFVNTSMSSEFSAFLELCLENRLRDTNDIPLTILHILEVLVPHEVSCENASKAVGVLQRFGSVASLATDPRFMLLEGYALCNDGKLSDAQRKLGLGLQVHPKNLALLLLDAMIAISGSENQRALDRYRTILHYYAEPPQEVFVGLALLHYKSGDLDKALKCVSRALACVSNDTHTQISIELRLFRVILLTARPELGERTDSFETVLQDAVALGMATWAQSYLITWVICEATLRTVPFADSIEFFRKLQSQLKPDKSPIASYVAYSLARALHQCGEHRPALESYRQSFAACQKTAIPHPSMLGLLQLSHVLSTTVSDSSLVKALEISGNLEARRHYVHTQLNAGSSDVLPRIQHMTTLEGAKDPESWILRALVERNVPVSARKSAVKSLELSEANADVSGALLCRLNLHALYVSLSDYESAHRVVEEISATNGGEDDLCQAALLHNSGVEKFQQGEYEKAAELFQRSVALGCVFDSIIALACCAYKSMQHPICLAIAQLAWQFQPTSLEVLLLLSLLGAEHSTPRDFLDAQSQSLLRTQEANTLFMAVLANVSAGCTPDMQIVKGALQNYQDAIRLAPNNIIAQHNAAVALSYIGHPEDAKKTFDAIIAMNVGKAIQRNALVNLGDIYATQRKYPLSCKYFAKAMEIDRKDADMAGDEWYIASRLAVSRLGSREVQKGVEVLKGCAKRHISTEKACSAELSAIALEVVDLIDSVGVKGFNERSRWILQVEKLETSLRSIEKSPSWESTSEKLQCQAKECRELLEQLRHVFDES